MKLHTRVLDFILKIASPGPSFVSLPFAPFLGSQEPNVRGTPTKRRNGEEKKGETLVTSRIK